MWFSISYRLTSGGRPLVLLHLDPILLLTAFNCAMSTCNPPPAVFLFVMSISSIKSPNFYTSSSENVCKNISYCLNICKNLEGEVRAPTVCLSAFKQTSGHNYFNPERTVSVLKMLQLHLWETPAKHFASFCCRRKQISSCSLVKKILKKPSFAPLICRRSGLT